MKKKITGSGYPIIAMLRIEFSEAVRTVRTICGTLRQQIYRKGRIFEVPLRYIVQPQLLAAQKTACSLVAARTGRKKTFIECLGNTAPGH